MMETKLSVPDLPGFERNFWDGIFRFTRIGTGSLGGKAGGLVFHQGPAGAAGRRRTVSRL